MQFNQSPKTLRRMNSLKNIDSPYMRSKNENLYVAKNSNENKSPQSITFRNVEHQELTDKIARIEKKVYEMKSDMLKKKQ